MRIMRCASSMMRYHYICRILLDVDDDMRLNICSCQLHHYCIASIRHHDIKADMDHNTSCCRVNINSRYTGIIPRLVISNIHICNSAKLVIRRNLPMMIWLRLHIWHDLHIQRPQFGLIQARDARNKDYNIIIAIHGTCASTERCWNEE